MENKESTQFAFKENFSHFCKEIAPQVAVGLPVQVAIILAGYYTCRFLGLEPPSVAVMTAVTIPSTREITKMVLSKIKSK